MAKVTYTGSDTGADGTVKWFGQSFEPGGSVNTDNEAFIAAAKGNQFFEVGGAGSKAAPTEDDDETEEDLDGFKIVPTGKGWFRVLDTEGKEVANGLRKKDAEAKVLELASART